MRCSLACARAALACACAGVATAAGVLLAADTATAPLAALAAGGASSDAPTRVPQSGQKRNSAASVAPHDGHAPAAGAPHA